MWFGFQDKVSYASQASLEFIATPLPQLPSAEINEAAAWLNLILHVETAQQMAGWIVRCWVRHLPSLRHSLACSVTPLPSAYSGSSAGRTLGEVMVDLATPTPGLPVGSVYPSAGDDSVGSLGCCMNHTGCRDRENRVKPASPDPLAPWSSSSD